ncbi:hypothetical protein Tco_0897679, partial [Tanacetum coccineum]
MTAKEQLAVDTMQALKASKKISRIRSHTGGSGKGVGVTPEVPDESTNIFITSSEGTGIKTGVPYEVKGTSEAKVESAIYWGSKNESDYSDEDTVDNINIKKTDDDEETGDEYVHDDDYVHNDADEEMKDAEVAVTGKYDNEGSDAA